MSYRCFTTVLCITCKPLELGGHTRKREHWFPHILGYWWTVSSEWRLGKWTLAHLNGQPRPAHALGAVLGALVRTLIDFCGVTCSKKLTSVNTGNRTACTEWGPGPAAHKMARGGATSHLRWIVATHGVIRLTAIPVPTSLERRASCQCLGCHLLCLMTQESYIKYRYYTPWPRCLYKCDAAQRPACIQHREASNVHKASSRHAPGPWQGRPPGACCLLRIGCVQKAFLRLRPVYLVSVGMFS